MSGGEYRHKKLSDHQNKIIDDYQKALPGEPVDVKSMAAEFNCTVTEGILPQGMSGAIKREKDGYAIYVNSVDKPERRRFTIAHELAHCLLHKDMLGDGIGENIMFRSRLSNVYETEANKIAADILMPDKILNVLIESKEYGFNELAEKFGVSRAAILVRLGIPEYPSYTAY